MRDVLGRQESLPVEEAKGMLLVQPIPGLDTEEVPLENAYGRVLAEDIFAPEDLPGFDRSTVDGYALRAEDTYGASEAVPVFMEVKGEVVMGREPDFSIGPGQCAHVPTGGMLPEGSDSVVMIEDTNKLDEQTIEVYRAVAVGENLIRADEDIKKAELVLPRGRRLRPQDVAALAGLGIVRLKVYRRPAVAIIATGDEVVPPDALKTKAQVRDVNSYSLVGMVLSENCEPIRFGIIRDNKQALEDTVRKALEVAHVVLITGGSSVGTKDYTKEVIEALGEPGVLFHGVQMKPGKPLLGGFVNGRYVFGLPGHPVAVGICFDEFVRPVLRRLSGLRERDGIDERKTVQARLSTNIPSRFGRQEYVRVRLYNEDGTMWAEPVFGKSGLIRTLVKADGVVVVPKESNGLYEGDTVEVVLFG
jgi:molybdopterin molybdotransferase